MPVINPASLVNSLTVSLKEIFEFSAGAYKKLYKELFLSDDRMYEKCFKTCFAPSLYDVHAEEKYENCLFCSMLSQSSCHMHCLKCSRGTYIHCSPALPGILCYENSAAHSKVTPLPWLYKETCRHFKRLERNKYYKNLFSYTSWVRLYNFEVLEGISKGFVDGQRPCHICAAVDYEIYKDCLESGEPYKNSPCMKLADLVGTKIIEEACL